MTVWLNENDIGELHRRGAKFYPADCKLTPSAADLARRLGIERGSDVIANTIAIGSDHGGFKLKNHLLKYLRDKDLSVEDSGCFSEEPVDYPDYAAAVAKAVASGEFRLGIMIDTIGVASAIAANKISGVRAAFCPTPEIAISAREHNDANLLTLGGGMNIEAADEIVDAFLTTNFLGGRHQRRIDKIKALER